MELVEQNLRSELSTEQVYLRFKNLTRRMLEIIWINYSGEYERYILLRSGAFVDINTYKTHPWIAMDVTTKDRMHLNKNFVYHPVPWTEYVRDRRIYPITPRRLAVAITLPMYSLRYRTLLFIRDLMRNPEEVDQLDLPNSLIIDLKKVIALRDNVSVLNPNRR